MPITIELPDAGKVIDEAVDFAEDVLESGGEEDKVIEAVADFLDALLPLDKFIPGPVGDALEAKDDDAFEVALRALKKAFEVDPEKRTERRARRAERKAERKARRAARKAEREARREDG
jgi:hypothetical protein